MMGSFKELKDFKIAIYAQENVVGSTISSQIGKPNKLYRADGASLCLINRA